MRLDDDGGRIGDASVQIYPRMIEQCPELDMKFSLTSLPSANLNVPRLPTRLVPQRKLPYLESLLIDPSSVVPKFCMMRE